MIERPESLYLGWLLIVGGSAIVLLRHRLAVYQRTIRDDRRERGPTRQRPSTAPLLDADAQLERTLLAAIGVLLMLGGLLLIAMEPVGWMLGLR